MNIKLKYVIEEMPHPWDDEKRAEGVKAFCLVRYYEPDCPPVAGLHGSQEVVAMFNWDSEALLLSRFVHNGGTIEASAMLQQLFEEQDKKKSA